MVFYLPRQKCTRLIGILLLAGLIGGPAAADEAHWAFQPIADPVPPEVADGQWPSRPLDRFVLHEIETAGLKPTPPAGRHVLIRRAYFDLIGLPPTPEQAREFVADPAPDAEAFATVVERLLASPQYGERWGRHWLDVARYGDSNGSDENHAYPHAWRETGSQNSFHKSNFPLVFDLARSARRVFRTGHKSL